MKQFLALTTSFLCCATLVLPGALPAYPQTTTQESNDTFDVNSGALDYDPDLSNDYNGTLDHNQAGPLEPTPPDEFGANESSGNEDWPPPADLGVVYSRQVINNRMQVQQRFSYSRTSGLNKRLPVQSRQEFTSSQAPPEGSE